MGPGGGASSWRNPRILTTLVLIFLCGAASGALMMKISVRAAPKPAAAWAQGGREISLDRFKSELDLTPRQAAEIALILDDFVMYYQSLQAQIDDMRDHGQDRIVQILDEQQRAKFERMLSELQVGQQQR
jgi:hypothetical protein